MLPALLRLVTALLLPLTLVAGLLTFPTTCACGASLPHDHPLLALGGHHHAAPAHGEPGHDHARDHGTGDTTARPAAAADDADQHQLTAPTGGAEAGRAPFAPLVLALAAVPSRRAPRRRPARAAHPPGEPAAPADPPPQHRTPR